MQVFISYAHLDREWLEGEGKYNLVSGWERAFQKEDVDFWWDHHRDSPIVGLWEEKIFERLAGSAVAVLLVSQNFVDSQFIVDRELPRIVEKAHKGEMHVLPVLIQPARWQELGIGEFQFTPHGHRPLTEFESSKNDWEKAKLEVRDMLKGIVALTRRPATKSPPVNTDGAQAPGVGTFSVPDGWRVPTTPPISESAVVRPGGRPLPQSDQTPHNRVHVVHDGTNSFQLRTVTIVLLGGALIVAGSSWLLARRFATEPSDAAQFSRDISAFVTGSTGRNPPVTLATDAVLRSEAGDPALELTRFFSPRATNGAFGRHWQLLLPYSMSGAELTAFAGYNLWAKVTLENNLTGERIDLSLDKDPDRIGYSGPTLSPWTRLVLQPNFGRFLTDGRGNKMLFSDNNMRLVALTMAGARWVFHYSTNKLVAIDSLPSAIKIISQGTDARETAIVEDLLDPGTFELKTDANGTAEFIAKSPGRWKVLFVADDRSGAVLVDRWDNRYSFRPLTQFTVLECSDIPKAPDAASSGFLLHYDVAGRVSHIDVGRKGHVSYEYDNQGRLSALTDVTGARRVYEYEVEDAVPRAVGTLKIRNIRIVGTVAASLMTLCGAALLLFRRRLPT
jgi:hypothetical protein